MNRHEYINDYIYFTVRADKREGKDVLIYCSGINLDRFLPMTTGRLGLGSNPVLSGLKLVKYELCTLAISKDATPRDHCGHSDCFGIAPTKEAWYSEALLIENPGSLRPDEIIDFSVKGMVKRIVNTSLSDHEVPGLPLEPYELQEHLDILCKAVVMA
ncbi:MAG: hypothetical protein HZA17_01900 [Nitrospirae bacterium]|nr:hypothetical protein [Nitrospirota bacterium]